MNVYAWKVDAAAVVCLGSVILLYENSILLVFIRDRGLFLLCDLVDVFVVMFLLCGMWKGEGKQKL